MITQEQITPMILEACPSFAPVYEAMDDEDKELLFASLDIELTIHLADLFHQKKLEEFPKLAALIEEFHINGDDYVQNFATIGILESVQNMWGDRGIDPEEFAAFLLPVSLQHWKSLHAFWEGKIPHIGTDKDKNS